MDDDFFLSNADAVVDPDAKMPAHKRKRMVEAARAYLATQPKKKGLRDGIKKGKVSKSDDEDEDAEAEGNMNQTVDDMDLVGSAAESDSDSESDKETAAQKRLRLARRYLAKVEEEVQDAADADADDIDAAQIDKDLIAERLKDDVLEAAGKLFRPIAAQYDALDGNALEIRTFKGGKKGHQLSVTAIALCMPSDAQDGTNLAGSTGSTPPIHLFSASKDAGLIKWDFYTGQRTGERPGSLKPTKKLLKAVSQKKLKEHKGHHDHILSVACSQDGKFLASAGRDKIVHIWSAEDLSLIGTLKHHRDTVTSLAFRQGPNQLYTASSDRTIKVWNIDEMSYIETLFGHQDQITSIDTLARERCVTTGSRDRTVRLWKIPEESQLVFRGGGHGLNATEELVVMDGMRKTKTDRDQGASGGSIDVVAMIDEDLFLTGSDSGAISLWNTTRKKPIFTKFKAHGESSDECRWITSLAAVPHSDLFASGSADGMIRLWKISPTKRSFSPLLTIPMTGFINSMKFFEAPDVSVSSVPTAADKAENKEDLSRSQKIMLAEKERQRRKSTKKVLYLAAGVGQEHRLGRWWRVKEARNAVKIIKLA